MYDDLIKQLRYCADATTCRNCVWKTECCPTDMQKNAADAIEELSNGLDIINDANIALHGALPQWIPVTERLPKYGTKVLVFAYGHDVLTARLCKEPENDYLYPVFDCNGIYSELAKQGRITHWMPLPEAPKDGE